MSKRCFRHYFAIALLSLVMARQTAAQVNGQFSATTEKMKVERLPDLNTARSGGYLLLVGGEPTVFGGHTTAFVPTATAEYYADGAWHPMAMAYPHDFPLCVPLSTGEVLLGGGAEKPLGIGQTFPTEVYDPSTHTFGSYGSLDTKRMYASGVEVDSGRVLITGNWYAPDQLELYDRRTNTFRHLRAPAQQRAIPYVLRIAPDDALIVSAVATRGDTLFAPVAETLKDGPIDVPLLQRYRLLFPHIPVSGADCYIGDSTRHDFSYLLPVVDSIGQVAVCRADGTDFSVLPTTVPIPMACQWGPISYGGSFLVDRQRQRAYLVGGTDSCRVAVVAIDYGRSLASQQGTPTTPAPAPLTLYCTDPLPNVGFDQRMLTPDGNLLMVGGHNSLSNNYSPYATACLLMLSDSGTDALLASSSASTSWQWWLLGILVIIAIIVVPIAIIVAARLKASKAPASSHQTSPPLEGLGEAPRLGEAFNHLMQTEQLFRRSDLKLQNVADALGTNRTYLISAIKESSGQTFTQYVNACRIDYAKHELRANPDKKVAAVGTDAGFSSESSFFRAFKAATGLSPSEWREQQQEKND